ncbi:hypothetical protein VTI28DRAFT_8578 [Corynascus sepedonium]
MNDFLHEDKGSESLKKLRTAVLWPISQARALRPWLGNRAHEFFLLYGPPVESYRAISDESPLAAVPGSDFVSKLKERCRLHTKTHDCIISFSVPVMVWMIAQRQFTFCEINEALETDLHDEEYEAPVFEILSKAQRVSPLLFERHLIHSSPGASPQSRDRPTTSNRSRKRQKTGRANSVTETQAAQHASSRTYAGAGSALGQRLEVDATFVQGLSPVASSNVEANAHLVGSVSTTPIHLINTNPQDCDGPRTLDGNSDGILAAQQASSLHLLANAAESRSVGAVPSPGQHDVATVSPQDSPLHQVFPNLRAPHGLSPCGVGNTASPLQPDLSLGGKIGSIEQTSASGYSNTSGLVTLTDGDCLRIGYLEEQAHAAGKDGMGNATEASTVAGNLILTDDLTGPASTSVDLGNAGEIDRVEIETSRQGVPAGAWNPAMESSRLATDDNGRSTTDRPSGQSSDPNVTVPPQPEASNIESIDVEAFPGGKSFDINAFFDFEALSGYPQSSLMSFPSTLES